MCYMAVKRARVGIRELRQNLSVYLRKVRRGETLEVTERGALVALLAPLPQTGDVIERLAAEGRLVQRAKGRLADLPPPLRVKLPKPTSEILDELREDKI